VIGGILAGVVPLLRGQAESLMLDSCTVHRPGIPVTDPETGVVAPSLTLVYTGVCKIQQTISQASNPTAGGHSFTVQDSRVDFPVSAGPFAVDDVVTMTASVLDPQLVGRKLRVVELFHKSYATAQRTRVEEVTA
jgi:hypothetical protein